MGQQSAGLLLTSQAGLQGFGIGRAGDHHLGAQLAQFDRAWPRCDTVGTNTSHLTPRARAAAAVAMPALPPDATITPLAGMGWTAGG